MKGTVKQVFSVTIFADFVRFVDASDGVVRTDYEAILFYTCKQVGVNPQDLPFVNDEEFLKSIAKEVPGSR